MEGGFPVLNCLLQHTLRSLCVCSDSSTSFKWVYAVFWRILPRNYPPPKWDQGGCLIDRNKGNRRNWILVWEDGFCDFFDCERAANGCAKARFGADIFFKMTHEVYNFGEGLVGKVASDNSHKWVFRDSPTENDPTFIPWNVSIDPQPKAWEAQFNSGIETIAIISVREGAIQLGSFDKVLEDLNTVISIQRMFGYLQSIPGIYVIQRPYLPNPFDSYNSNRPIQNTINDDLEKLQMTGLKRQSYDQQRDNDPTSKSMYFGDNSLQNGISGQPLWSIPPLLPPMNVGSFLPPVPKLCYDDKLRSDTTNQNLKGCDEHVTVFGEFPAIDVKVEIEGVQDEGIQEEKPNHLTHTLRLDKGGFEAENSCKS